MIDIASDTGDRCVTLDLVPLDGSAWAIPVVWHTQARGLPAERELAEGVERILARARQQGARFVDCRVLTDTGRAEGRDLQCQRANRLRETLNDLGFKQGEGRIEVRLPLDEALAALDAQPGAASGKTPDTPEPVWQCVDTHDPAALQQAAQLLQQATAGDPGSHPEDDALGFLLAFRDGHGGAQAPGCLQVGFHQGTPAVLLALALDVPSGWCSIHYLAVVPGKRRLGLGHRAFRHGLRNLAALGGREYHDGTGEHNLPALALLGNLGQVPLRRMEEWRLEL